MPLSSGGSDALRHSRSQRAGRAIYVDRAKVNRLTRVPAIESALVHTGQPMLRTTHRRLTTSALACTFWLSQTQDQQRVCLYPQYLKKQKRGPHPPLDRLLPFAQVAPPKGETNHPKATYKPV